MCFIFLNGCLNTETLLSPPNIYFIYFISSNKTPLIDLVNNYNIATIANMNT